MSDSGINQSTARSGRRPPPEGVGLWRDTAATASAAELRGPAAGRVQADTEAVAVHPGPHEPAQARQSHADGFAPGSGESGSAGQPQPPGSGPASPQRPRRGGPFAMDPGSDIAALLDFAVGLGAQAEPEVAAVVSEPAPPPTAVAGSPVFPALRMSAPGHGASATFESALGLGSGDSWYRPNDRPVDRPASSTPDPSSRYDRSTHE